MGKDPLTAVAREEIEESVAMSTARRLEREFGTTIRLAGRVRTSKPGNAGGSFGRKSTSRLTSGTSRPMPFKLPVVVGRRSRLSDGKATFTFKIAAIPKTTRARTLRNGTKVGPGAAGKGARYSAGERGGYLVSDRTQANEIGDIILISNIDTDIEKCIELYDTVERHERDPSVDQIEADFGKSRWLWRKVVGHPACDPAIVAAYSRNPNGKVVVELCRGGMALQDILREYDFRPPAKPSNQAARDRADGIKWRLGRGGRTQWRVVVGFPSEFTAAQRVEAVELIGARFGKMKCMYMAVIHEPSAKNDHRNFHCHVDIYDRPCRRLTGKENEDLANVSARWIKDVRAEYRAGKFKNDIGRWDFEVVRECTYASGNKRPQKVFRQNKSTEMRKYSVPEDSRRDIALIINQIAKRDFGRELVNHRSYEERGIDKKPDRPLGPDAHAMECKGFASEIGLRNEQNHAEASRKEIAKLCGDRIKELYVAQLALAAQTMDAMFLGARSRERKAAAAGFETARELAVMKRDSAFLQLEINRNLSSSLLAIRTNARVVRNGEDKLGTHAAILSSARRYCRGWVAAHPDEISSLKELKTSITKLENGPDLGLLIDRASVPLTDKEWADFIFQRLPKLPILPTRIMESMLSKSTAAPLFSSKLEPVLSPSTPAVAVPPSANMVPAVATSNVFKPLVMPPLVSSSKPPSSLTVPALISTSKSQGEKSLVVSAGSVSNLSLVPPEVVPSWTSRMERFTRLSLMMEAADESRSHESPAQVPADGLAKQASSLGHELAQKLAKGPDPALNIASAPVMGLVQSDKTGEEKMANPTVEREIETAMPDVVSKGPISITTSMSQQLNPPTRVGPDGQVFAEEPGQVSEPINPPSVELEEPTEAVATWYPDQTDLVADIVEGMLKAFVERIEKGHVLLIESDGTILAAPDQELERGDDFFIKKTQAALRLVKARQDVVALEVSKDLWTNSQLLVAGRTDTVDRLTVELMRKWVTHPDIALVLRQIGSPLTASCMQPAILAEAAAYAEPQKVTVPEPIVVFGATKCAKTPQDRLRAADAIRCNPAAKIIIKPSRNDAWKAEQIKLAHSQRPGAGDTGGVGG